MSVSCFNNPSGNETRKERYPCKGQVWDFSKFELRGGFGGQESRVDYNKELKFFEQ